MPRWKDSLDWSYWICATCGEQQFDPDTVKVTTCSKGHTNYLGAIEGQWRRAFKSAQDRRSEIRQHRVIVQMISEAAAKVDKLIKVKPRVAPKIKAKP